MNRRAFFSSLAAIAAGAQLDQERLLWRPGKLISIPPPSAYWGNRPLKIGDTITFRLPARFIVREGNLIVEIPPLQLFTIMADYVQVASK